MLENHYRVGRQLSHELSGIWAARRGTCRGLYRIEGKGRARARRD